MRLVWKLLTVFVILVASTSCIHCSLDRKYTGPEKLPPEIVDYYSYEVVPLRYTETLLAENDKYFIKRISFSAVKAPPASLGYADKQDTVLLDYYKVQNGGEKTPIIIVLPILGGSNVESKAFCAYFAEHGIAALMVHRDEKQKKSINPDNIELSFRSMVMDHRLVVDWIATRKELDLQRIGVFGISMGGIKACLIASIDRRIGPVVAALAGGDLPYIITRSKENGVVKVVRAIMAGYGLNRDQIRRLLKDKIRTDPLLLAKYADAGKILLIGAAFDRIVPFSKQRELGRALGGPRRVILFSGHYSAVVYAPYIRWLALKFFKEKFQEDSR